MKIKSLIFTLFFVSCSLNHSNAAEKFNIKSSEVKENQTITNRHVFNGFGCNGDNISPQISWQNAPKDTKSFALTVYDPDAPTGSGWWHYVAINIPNNYKEFASGFSNEDKFTIKDGINQVRNDFGKYQFGGPCPPKGDKPHRYIFTIYALKTDKLEIDSSTTAALAGFMINANSIAKSSFTARYGR